MVVQAPTILTYSVAVLSVAAAVAGAVNTFLQIDPFVYHCFFARSCSLHGLADRPGCSRRASILAFAYYFAPSYQFVRVEFKDIPRIVLFAIAALLWFR